MTDAHVITLFDSHGFYSGGGVPVKMKFSFGSVVFSGGIRVCKVFGDNVLLWTLYK